MKNKLIVPGLLLAVAAVVAFGTAQANAQSSPGNVSLIDRLVSRFNLKESEVSQVFDEVRQEHQTAMQKAMEERLNQAVKDGKLTQAQKDAVLAKHKELQAQHDKDRVDFQNMTREERKNAMDARHTQMQNWAAQQGIDSSYLFGGFGKGMGMGRGMHMR